MADKLKPREALFVRHYASGKSAAESARLAGYSESYVRKSAYALADKPAIKAALADAGETLKAATLYDARTAMGELDEAMAFAKTTNNATAYVRACELRMKLHGLLIDKLEHGSPGNFRIVIKGVDDDVVDVDSTPVPEAPAARMTQLPRPKDIFQDE